MVFNDIFKINELKEDKVSFPYIKVTLKNVENKEPEILTVTCPEDPSLKGFAVADEPERTFLVQTKVYSSASLTTSFDILEKAVLEDLYNKVITVELSDTILNTINKACLEFYIYTGQNKKNIILINPKNKNLFKDCFNEIVENEYVQEDVFYLLHLDSVLFPVVTFFKENKFLLDILDSNLIYKFKIKEEHYE